MKKILPVALSLGATLFSFTACATAQSTSRPGLPGATPPTVNAGPIDLAPDVRQVLKLLQDRENTLKDFTAKISYDNKIVLTGDKGGQAGTIDFIQNPAKGAIFSVDFTDDTDGAGKALRKHHMQVIFDGKDFTTKDFEPKEVIRANVLPAGAKPGDAVSLNGPLPLPIGLDVEDVAHNFDVTLLASTDANQSMLKLKPRTAGKFDFKELTVTVDKKLELPIKMIQTSKTGDITTLTFSDIQVNTGKAAMQDPKTPAGWTERK